MRLIKTLIERKLKIEKLEDEVDGLRKELESLRFEYNRRTIKRCNRTNTLLSHEVRKFLYSSEVKLRGRKRIEQLEEKKIRAIELIKEMRQSMNEQEIENVKKIG